MAFLARHGFSPVLLEIFVKGIPAAAGKGPRGTRFADWTRDLVSSLADRGRVTGPYEIELEFILAPDVAQELNPANPHGPDLDNLAKPVLDALAKGILADGDGAVMVLRLLKRRAVAGESAGVMVRLLCVKE